MEIKNLQSMISECISYADEISNNPALYPSDSRMPLRDLLRYDMTLFLGFLYEPDNGNLADQIGFIETNLKMILTESKFLQLVEQKCNDPRFLTEAPSSLQYFINADLAEDINSKPGSVAKSKYVVDCFRKMGEGFINYEKVKDETKKIVSDYIGVIHLGHFVEMGKKDEIFENPIHPYTKSLLSAIPEPNPITEPTRKLIVYDKDEEGVDYTKGTQHFITPDHMVLATDDELEKWM